MRSRENIQGDLEGDVLHVGLGKDATDGADGTLKTLVGDSVMPAIPTNGGDEEAETLQRRVFVEMLKQDDVGGLNGVEQIGVVVIRILPTHVLGDADDEMQKTFSRNAEGVFPAGEENLEHVYLTTRHKHQRGRSLHERRMRVFLYSF